MNVQTMSCVGCGRSVRFWLSRKGSPFCSGFCKSRYNQKKIASKNKLQKRERRVKKRRVVRSDFYLSREWREVRYLALKSCGGKCQLCGLGRKDGRVLHVDHIKPISKFPNLKLTASNLQVLCKDCNLGKSNIDQTDWR